MKRAASLFLALLILFSLGGCMDKLPIVTHTEAPEEPTPTATPEIAMPLSSAEFEGMDYRDAEKKLRVLGFTSITVEEYADLTSQEADKDETVHSISIGSSKSFGVGDTFDADAAVVLEYHTLRRAAVPLSSGDLGSDAEAAAQSFRDAGFVNVRTETVEDLEADAAPILTALVNGQDSFLRDDKFPFDADIVIISHVPAAIIPGMTELTAEQVYASCSPAVFYIEIYDEYGWCTKTGSGFFIREDGIAVTNYHVISGASSAWITCSDTGAGWEVLGIYDYSVDEDWAILQIDGDGFPILEVGSLDYDVGGATVYAIGSPLGLQNTISSGIISNPHRWEDGVNYIQMNAAISLGSSGGALLNKYGQVIGITSATYTEGQNLNLALPMTYLEDAVVDSWTPLGQSSGTEPSGILTLMTNQVSMNVGDYADVDLVAIESNCPSVVSVRFSIEDDKYVSCAWQGWQGDNNTLRITGLSVGSTTVTIYFLISETQTVLDSKSVQVTVTPEGSSSVSGEDVVFEVNVDYLPISLFAQGEVNVTAYYAPDDNGTYVSWYADDPSLINCEWTTWDGNDTTLIINPVSAGSTELTIVYCTNSGELLATATVKLEIFYAALEVSETEVGMEAGDEYVLTVAIRSDNPGLHTIRFKIYGDDIVSCAWGDWFSDGKSCPLTITGLKSGEADVEIILLDKDTQTYLYSVSVSVSVE